MDANSWNRIKAIHADALEREPARRASFLDSACGDDRQLRGQVESLLAAEAEAGDFLSGSTRDKSGGASRFIRGASIAHDLIEKPGTRLGRYVLGEPLGEGGFGTVYRAEQIEPVRRTVALKVIKPGMDTREVIARFEAERQALAIMDHSGIAKVFDAGATESGRPYFVMELVEGPSITQYCEREGLALRERLSLFVRVCRAVQHAHQKGVIHRDLKPSNVLVVGDGGEATPRVIDFGVAKALHARLSDRTVTQARHLIGTPAYMSPEQAESALNVDTRTDVYSLGVLLYELLTGQPPFDSRQLLTAGYTEMLRVIREVAPQRPGAREPGLPRDLDWIVMKALEKNPDRRYDSAGALADDVQRHLRDEPVQAGPPSAVYRVRKFARRHRGLIGASGATLGALLVGLGIAVAALVQTRAERDAAEQARTDADRARGQTQAVNQFLEDMLTSADTAQTGGQVLTVRDVLDEAAARLNDGGAESRQVEAALRRTIGRTYSMIGEYSVATPHLERALDLQSELRGRTAPETIRARLHLADNLLSAGDRRRSEQLVNDSLAALRAGEPNEPELLARHLYTLGRLRKTENDYPAAVEALREAARLFREHGTRAGPLARTLGELGVVLMRTADLREAEATLREAIAVAQRAHGPRSADAMGLRGHLAILCRRTGRLSEAEAMYREVLDVQRSLHGPEHPLTVGTMVNLGALLVDRRADAEAEAMLGEACERLAEVHGKDSYPYAVALGLLARARSGLGDFAGAEQAVRSSLAVFERTMGPEHEYVATSLFDLGSLQLKNCDTEAAEASFQRAMGIYQRIHGPVHPLIARMLEKLGEAAFQRGDPESGAVHFRQALGIYAAKLGEDDVELANCRSAWAKQELASGSAAEAERLLRTAIGVREAAGLSDRGALLADRVQLGRCVAAQSRFDEAEQILLGAHEDLASLGESGRPAASRAATLLAELYDEWGRPQAAAQWRPSGSSTEPNKVAGSAP